MEGNRKKKSKIMEIGSARWGGRELVVILNKVVPIDLVENVTFEQRLVGGKSQYSSTSGGAALGLKAGL